MAQPMLIPGSSELEPGREGEMLEMIRSFTVVSLIALVAGACAAEVEGPLDEHADGHDHAERHLSTQEAALFADTKVKWKNTTIPVCWINPTNTAQQRLDRAFVQRTIQNGWNRVSAVNFVGWGKCGKYHWKKNNGIRIKIEDAGPKVYAFGKLINKKSVGMRLNFTYKKWPNVGKGETSWCAKNKTNRTHCMRRNALHEFGHALGFKHEQDAPHNKFDHCGDQKTGSKGNKTYGWYDKNSVMNYCADTTYGLSLVDIYGVRQMYGKPAWTSFIDDAYYMGINKDVFKSGMSAVTHYTKWGGKEGRAPMPLFDGGWYLKKNPDVKNAGMNPLYHYITYGAMEGRNPHPLFDVKWYLKKYPEVFFSGLSAWEHFLFFGSRKGYKAGPNTKWRWGVAEGDLFDEAYYLAKNQDVAKNGYYGNKPMRHFIQHGQKEKRSPQARFDSKYYLNKHKGVANAVKAGWMPSAFYHWIGWGLNEGRKSF